MRDTIRQFRIWILLWLLNALFAMTMMLPFSLMTVRLLGHSLESNQVLRNQFSLFWGDSINHLSICLPENISPFILLSFLYTILWIFLNGGILYSLHQEQTPSFSRFAQGAASYFLPFFILFLLSSCSLLIFCVLPNFLLTSLLSTIYQKIENPFWSTYLQILKNIVLFAMLHFIFMVFDYLKILLVIKESRFSFQALLEGLSFCIHHFKWLAIAYLIIVLFAFIIYLISIGLFQSSNMLSILAGFSIQQVCILLLMGIRILHYATGRRLFLWFSSKTV